MRTRKEVIGQMITTVMESAEFVRNSTPIHPGSELAQQILGLSEEYAAIQPWQCPHCNEPHEEKPRECSYCGTKPEA